MKRIPTGKAMRNYYLEKSRNVKYCENISDGGTYGFHFSGDNDNSNWSVNEIGVHEIGLLIDDIPGASSGRISKQVRKGNLWEADGNLYGDKAARCNAQKPDFSEFKIEDDNDPELFPTKIEPATGWFFEESGDPDYCFGTVRHISPFEDEIASGDTVAISEAEQWEATRLLLETLLRYPGYLTGDTVMQNFYTANLTSTTAGQFAQINQMVREGGFSTSVWWDVREDKLEEFEAAKVILDSLNARDTLSDLANNIFIPGDAMLPVVHAEMIALADSIQIIEAYLGSLHDAVLAQALLELDSITITEDYEEAYEILSTYQIKSALGYEPEAAGYEDLMELADSDETVYGAAVRHARYYLSECDRYERIAPEMEEERVVSTLAPNRAPAMAIDPNPAADNIRVTLEHTSGVSQWSIVSPFGTLVRTGQWPEGQTSKQIGLEGMVSGAYYFVMHTSTGAILTKKLLVLH